MFIKLFTTPSQFLFQMNISAWICTYMYVCGRSIVRKYNIIQTYIHMYAFFICMLVYVVTGWNRKLHNPCYEHTAVLGLQIFSFFLFTHRHYFLLFLLPSQTFLCTYVDTYKHMYVWYKDRKREDNKYRATQTNSKSKNNWKMKGKKKANDRI